MKSDNNIDKYFRENLYDFQAAPPEGVWSSIEQDLKKSSKKPIIPLYIKVAAGIVLLASLAAILWRVTYHTNNTSPTFISEESIPEDIILDETDAVIEQSDEIASNNQAGQIENVESFSQSNEEPLTTLVVATATGEEGKEQITSSLEDNQKAVKDPENKILPDIEPVYDEDNEMADKTIPAEEVSSEAEEEPKEIIDKNDLIVQQNLLALEESSDDAKRNSGSRWTIGGQAGPQYSYRDVSLNPDYQNLQDYNKFEDGMLAFAGGVNVQVQAAKRFSIQSGVYYSKIGQEKSSMVYGDLNNIRDANNFEISENESPEQIPNSTGTFAFSKALPPPVDQPVESSEISEGTVNVEQSFEFVEIPLIFKYYVVDKKLDISINGGLWTNILIGNRAIATDNQDFHVEDKTNDINTLNYSGSIGLGFNYPVTSSLLISLDPIFKYYLSPINSNPETEVHPYSFGIMTGINFNF